LTNFSHKKDTNQLLPGSLLSINFYKAFYGKPTNQQLTKIKFRDFDLLPNDLKAIMDKLSNICKAKDYLLQ